MTIIPSRREKKKPRIRQRGKRYRCTICGKRSPRTTKAPYYCPAHEDYCPAHEDHRYDDSQERE